MKPRVIHILASLALDLLSVVVRSAVGLPLPSSPRLKSGPCINSEEEEDVRVGFIAAVPEALWRVVARSRCSSSKSIVCMVRSHRTYSSARQVLDRAAGLAASIGRCSSTRPETQPAFQTGGSDDSRRPSELLSKSPFHDTRSGVAPVVETPGLPCPAIA
ncbi:hypothetical protein J3F83DRAFT_724560 [Trichoderma novae-zelandiae]